MPNCNARLVCMKIVIVILLHLNICSRVFGHGYLMLPKARGQVFGDKENKAACESNTRGQVTNFESGQVIDVMWSRNNHLGGFIRFSIVPVDSVSKENFDENAFAYICREANCNLKQCDSLQCGDDGGTAPHDIKCYSRITLPNYLPKGDYVLQWVWFAVGSSDGDIGKGTSQFVNCADIRLTSDGTEKKPLCPTFTGGDRGQRIEKKDPNTCYYFASNEFTTDYVQAGPNAYKFGIPGAIERCRAKYAGVSAGTAPPPVGLTPVVATKEYNPGKVEPNPNLSDGAEKKQGGLKNEWEFCATNEECANNCCSDKYSTSDGKMKCTPNGCD